MLNQTTVKQDNTTHRKKSQPRELVCPGEIISTDSEKLPGRGTIKKDNKISSIFLGLKEEKGNQVSVLPLNGLYNPTIGDKIIARVLNRTPTKWIMDINAISVGLLSPKEAAPDNKFSKKPKKYAGSYKKKEKDSLEDYKVGDVLICKIISGNRIETPKLTLQGHYLGPITSGTIIEIPPPKIPRVIGRKGSMISVLKENLNCSIFVAQNGRIWIKCKTFEEEKLLIEIIHKIENEAHTTGLTDRITYTLKKEKELRGIK